MASRQNTHREPVQSVGKLRRIFNLVFEAGDAAALKASDELGIRFRSKHILGSAAEQSRGYLICQIGIRTPRHFDLSVGIEDEHKFVKHLD